MANGSDPVDLLLWNNPEYLDEMLANARVHPDGIDPSWQSIADLGDDRTPSPFESPTPTNGAANGSSNGVNVDGDLPRFLTSTGAVPDGIDKASLDSGIRVYDLIHTFREHGHLIADLDPLGTSPKQHPFLSMNEFAFSDADLDQVVTSTGFYGADRATVREYMSILRETYCGPIGVEYMGSLDKNKRDWLQKQMEPRHNRPNSSPQNQRRLLEELVQADLFEETLHKMYPGSKRFSLEGATTLITLLKSLSREALQADAQQMVLGMAHRGRLNVLANFMQKPVEYILAEFEGRPLAAQLQGYGDVKYHLGYSSDITDGNGRSLHLSMAFNPSHLEIIDPVVEGIVRAKQDQLNDKNREYVVPVLLHGDAAFSGQGVVAETFTLSRLEGYRTGGSIHIIVNNQVGFTAEPRESRSTYYASDLAAMVRAPVFHVNADHPEAVALVGRLAMRYRQRFHEDIVIDLVGFRRHGHNEMDDATFTQPLMVKRINKHKAVSRIYAAKLELDKIIEPGELDSMIGTVKTKLKDARELAKELPEQAQQTLGGAWQGIEWRGDAPPEDNELPTQVDTAQLKKIASSLLEVPEHFEMHSRLKRLMTKRRDVVLNGEPLDWGAGEMLALGSLLVEGTNIRFSGQDACRGTFSHRHATYSEANSGVRYTPLQHITEDQARFEIINSPLSEEAVLGFEYGYSGADPWSLVIWEAQFGDFVNGAQVVIDQLIASCEYKWGRLSGLVMLLPHGYEGQGPEHSSARLERFLELCAENNLQVCNLTTPAQYFHVLRRQMKRKYRKPLVIMSPKSLLRLAEATSELTDFSDGRFQTVIPDGELTEPDKVRRVLMCSGKVFYSLNKAREARGIDDIAIVRIEQLYPFPAKKLRAQLDSYPNLESIYWVQEEPRNMGAWRHMLHRFQHICPESVTLHYAGRDSRAATATGSLSVHRKEEEQLIDAAFNNENEDHVVRRQ